MTLYIIIRKAYTFQKRERACRKKTVLHCFFSNRLFQTYVTRSERYCGLIMMAVATALNIVTSKQNVATHGHRRSKILSLLFSGIVLTKNSFLNSEMFCERIEITRLQ